MTDPARPDEVSPPAAAATAPPAPRTRRAVLRTASLVTVAGGGAAVFAGCAPGQASSGPPAATAGSESASKAAPGGPSVSAADVPVGSGVILDQVDYVVTQPSKGSYKAFTAICTHQQCKVSEMRGDRIRCGCHQSEFSIQDGSALSPPAQQPLKQFKTTVAGGKIYVQE